MIFTHRGLVLSNGLQSRKDNHVITNADARLAHQTRADPGIYSIFPEDIRRIIAVRG